MAAVLLALAACLALAGCDDLTGDSAPSPASPTTPVEQPAAPAADGGEDCDTGRTRTAVALLVAAPAAELPERRDRIAGALEQPDRLPVAGDEVMFYASAPDDVDQPELVERIALTGPPFPDEDPRPQPPVDPQGVEQDIYETDLADWTTTHDANCLAWRQQAEALIAEQAGDLAARIGSGRDLPPLADPRRAPAAVDVWLARAGGSVSATGAPRRVVVVGFDLLAAQVPALDLDYHLDGVTIVALRAGTGRNLGQDAERESRWRDWLSSEGALLVVLPRDRDSPADLARAIWATETRITA